ncbi:MAG TPA: hypothetical protein VEH53_02840 [archaeon]|nr:hypothetical protein [archaeon]
MMILTIPHLPILHKRRVIDVARLRLLRWRLIRGRALPAFGTALLTWLDRYAVALQQKRRER